MFRVSLLRCRRYWTIHLLLVDDVRQLYDLVHRLRSSLISCSDIGKSPFFHTFAYVCEITYMLWYARALATITTCRSSLQREFCCCRSFVSVLFFSRTLVVEDYTFADDFVKRDFSIDLLFEANCHFPVFRDLNKFSLFFWIIALECMHF